jgi:ketosteroid isomerase-like protein
VLHDDLTPRDPRTIITRFNQAWEDNDIEAALAFIADDAVYVLHVAETALPFGGETRGKSAIRAAFTGMRSDFDYILYRPFPMSGAGETLHGQVEFIYRHRASGEELSGRFRLVWTMRNGLIVRCEEYHDAARIEAFMRLFGAAEKG